MPRWTSSDKARIEYRRRAVEAMSNRGARLYEIVDELEKQGIVNPKNGKPYSVMTVSRDLKENTQRWMEETVQERGLHKARELAELREARRVAWSQKDMGEVRLNLLAEMKLLGTDEPIRLEVDWQQEAREAGLDPADVFERYVQAAASALADSAEAT